MAKLKDRGIDALWREYDELREGLPIDRKGLDSELEQSYMVYQQIVDFEADLVSLRDGIAERESRELAAARERIRAEVEAEEGKAPTEKRLDALQDTDQAVIDTRAELREYKDLHRRVSGFLETWKRRDRAIDRFIDLHLTGYFAGHEAAEEVRERVVRGRTRRTTKISRRQPKG